MSFLCTKYYYHVICSQFINYTTFIGILWRQIDLWVDSWLMATHSTGNHAPSLFSGGHLRSAVLLEGFHSYSGNVLCIYMHRPPGYKWMIRIPKFYLGAFSRSNNISNERAFEMSGEMYIMHHWWIFCC